MIIENDGVVCSSVDVVSVLTTIVVSAMCMSDVFVTILFVMFTLFFLHLLGAETVSHCACLSIFFIVFSWACTPVFVLHCY